jgi:hypothetical protein
MSQMKALRGVAASDLLGQHVEGATRIVLVHERQQEFRALVLFEVLAGVMFVVCCFPLIIVGLVWALFSEVSVLDLLFDEDRRTSRTYRYWHELVIRVFGADNTLAFETRAKPANEEEGDALVASVLSIAEQNGLVVVEMLSNPSEVAEVWFGGQPLLAHPEERHEDTAAGFLQREGFQVKEERELVELRWEHQPRGIPSAVVALVLSPLNLLSRPREMLNELRDAWADLMRRPPKTTRVLVRAGSIETEVSRDGVMYEREVIDGRDLVGITFSPALGYDRAVTRLGATLRFIGRTRSGTLPLHLDRRDVGRALRDFLVGATLKMRQLHPELGLASMGVARPARCPYCGTLHVMGPSTKCPSCGAWAGAFR